MGTAFGPREKAIFSQTLAPLLKGLEGSEIVAELKNDIIVHGKLVAVDCFMNLTMENVGMTREDGFVMTFEFFFLQNKNLRYVRIPDHVSIRRTLKEQLDIVTGEKARSDRRKAKEKRANYLKKRQQKNMAKEVQDAFSKKDELDSKNQPGPGE